jgi:hypothetical protein
VGVVLASVLTGTLAYADPPANATPTSSMFERFFGKPEPRPAYLSRTYRPNDDGPKVGPYGVTRPRPAPPKPVASEIETPAPAAAVVARDDAQKTYFRRIAVCDRLREVAVANNDRVLEEKVRKLEEQAWEAYNTATAHLPGNRTRSTAADEVADQLKPTDSLDALTHKPAAPRKSAQAGTATTGGQQ